MPSASRVAAGWLGKIHEHVGRYDINQILLRATTNRAQVLALSVQPSRRPDMAESFKLLAEMPQRKSFRKAAGDINSHDAQKIYLGLSPSASSLLHAIQ